MFGITNLAAFIAAAVLLIITPGADTMYIMGRSISQGKRAGIYSALGISAGTLIHTIAAALGLSIILAESALAFAIIKYLGAAYLVFLGIKSIVSKADQAPEPARHNMPSDKYHKIFLSGMLTNVLNPKVALFFLAFLPQFVDPGYAQSAWPFLILGLLFVGLGMVWCFGVALSSARLGLRLSNNQFFKVWLNKLTGGLFLYLGIRLALVESK